MPAPIPPTPDDSDALAARIAAVRVLQAVLGHRRAMDEAMPGTPEFAALAGPERAFAGYLVRTALRRLGQIDALIDHCIADPLPKKARPVRDILRIGITQLLFSETADHAAVSTTTEICKTLGQIPFAKLANAVMRRLQREGKGLLSRQDAARLNTPDWLFASWQLAYGAETARAIADAHLQIPPLDLTARENAAGWAETLSGTLLLGGTIRLDGAGDVTKLPGFDAGAWWVQDAAARLPVALLGDIRGRRAIDLCAAPGGKTLELAAAGAEVTAVDISQKRLDRVAENLQRTGLSATLVAADGKIWTPPAPADIVVLDAPCSSTGTLRRHPDVAHLKSAEDIDKLAAVQDALLVSAAAKVAPGGTLIFSTCSLQPKEGPQRIAAFLEKHGGQFRRVPIAAAEIGGLADAITVDGDLRTLPVHLAEVGGMDGFFAARLVRHTG